MEGRPGQVPLHAYIGGGVEICVCVTVDLDTWILPGCICTRVNTFATPFLEKLPPLWSLKKVCSNTMMKRLTASPAWFSGAPAVHDLC